jgi:hypothetical protein
VRAHSTAGTAVRHVAVSAIEAILVVAILVTLAFSAMIVAGVTPGTDPVLAAKGGNGGDNGKLTATISLVQTRQLTSTSEVTFAVTRSVADDTVMWVTNKCFDSSGVLLSKVDLPVLWGMWYSLEGTSGPFDTDGSTCTAYVTLRPWQGRVLSDAILTYSPAG